MDIAQAYRVLNLAAGSSADELHSAWKGLVLKHHPDRYEQFGESELIKAAQTRTKAINRAYSCLRVHLSRDALTDIGTMKGIAPDSASLVRKTTQCVAQTQAAVELWSRHLNRSRVGLTDGQRLTADTYANQKEYLILRVSIQALVEKRDASISVLLETSVLRSAREAFDLHRLNVRKGDLDAFDADSFLPTGPEQLMPLLSEIQKVGEQAVLNLDTLARRFEQLEVERLGLGQRTKLQHRTLRQSLKPFIDAARLGRERYDAAETCARQCRAIIKVEQSAKVESELVLKSRRHQLTALFETLETLQFRQIEGDAAQTVYAQLLNRQSRTQSLSRSTFDETEKVSTQIRALLAGIRLKHSEYPQAVLKDLQAELSKMARFE